VTDWSARSPKEVSCIRGTVSEIRCRLPQRRDFFPCRDALDSWSTICSYLIFFGWRWSKEKIPLTAAECNAPSTAIGAGRERAHNGGAIGFSGGQSWR